MIPMLIQTGKLQIPIEIQAMLIQLRIMRDHDMLVFGRLREHDGVFIELLFHQTAPVAIMRGTVSEKGYGDRSGHDYPSRSRDQAMPHEVEERDDRHRQVQTDHHETDLRQGEVLQQAVYPHDNAQE